MKMKHFLQNDFFFSKLIQARRCLQNGLDLVFDKTRRVEYNFTEKLKAIFEIVRNSVRQ